MKSIMILTKNILVESELEQKLKSLGYEVFSSSQIFNEILLGFKIKITPIFNLVIISSSISEEEVETILSIGFQNVRFLRLENFEGDDNALIESQKCHSIDYIDEDCSLKTLREALSKKVETEISDKKNPLNQYLHQKRNFQQGDKKLYYENFISSMSAKERQVFRVLVDSEGDYIDRKSLASHIWNSSSSSNLAQLSQIISRIRVKMEKNNIINLSESNSSYLITHWKKGYTLSETFFQDYIPVRLVE
ncbi:winged helix-turn-helix domain-containing protein [Enterococcus sp. HY326]|uniref:winged helix-turn-helix domain-containing protein n=1 Tax=Enterococcus sp. HY326 TaxID=2971265 RepID=UPI00223FDDD4|nr:helix-turn-helix domain-containing protein [Enterococcus sp. HY326]